MKKLLTFLSLTLVLACSKSDDINLVTVNLNFSHNFDGTNVTAANFNAFNFTNAAGNELSIESLRYLLSNITFKSQLYGEIKATDYVLIDVTNNSNLTLQIQNLPATKHQLLFRFGLADAQNLDGFYQDLNVANFNVPMMMGGGYHFMQMDGKFKTTSNQIENYNFHVIRAFDTSNSVTEDTSILVDLGEIDIQKNTTIEVKMNIAEWFKNPNIWDLNSLSTNLMANYNAQILMNANGKNVFSLGTVSQ